MKTDLNYLKTMSGNSTDLMSEMIDLFSEQVDVYTAEMQRLLDNKDYEALGKLAHKAKSSVAIMGMGELSRRLKQLEINTKDLSNLTSYQETVNFFKSECHDAIIELREFKNQLS